MTKYTGKKTKNQVVSPQIEKHLSKKGYERFVNCGNWIEFFADKDVEKLKVYRADFCNNRFCPMCAWRMAVKDAMKISVLMRYLEAEHDMAFILLTLTAPNVKGGALKSELDRFNKAFKNLVDRDEVVRMNHGCIRKLEVTYNKKRDDYHPHFHCIFAVDKHYFKSRKYIKQARWLALWQECMKDPSITEVDVRRVKREASGKSEISECGAVQEVSKYVAKDSDYAYSPSVFDVFYGALKGRQVITYSGLFAEANKKYKAGELDSYKTLDDTEYVWLLMYRWGGAEYVEKKRKAISQEEYKALKREAIDEMSVT